jgi:hypothetical protein
LIENTKNSSVFKDVMKKFPDAELIDVTTVLKENEND